MKVEAAQKSVVKCPRCHSPKTELRYADFGSLWYKCNACGNTWGQSR